MAISTEEFWQLLADSGLRTLAECHGLRQEFERDETPAEGRVADDAVAIAKWVVGRGAVTQFQAKVLLSGRAGPFVCGQYQLRDRLPQGRLTGCFTAVHLPTRHRVLLWTLGGPVAHDESQRAIAIEQMTEACRLVHPCLMRVYELIEWGAATVAVMERLSGSSAEEALVAHGPMPAEDACRAMRHIAQGVAEMHARGVVHGDIRPENVWIDKFGNGRLLRTPLSRPPQYRAGYWTAWLRQEHENGDATNAAREMAEAGVPADQRAIQAQRFADYASPELAYDGAEADVLSDVYAIGCTLYQLLSGRPPFAGGSLEDKLARHASEPIESLEPHGVSAELARVVSFAMAKDHRVRYQSSAELADALGYFIEPARRDELPRPASTSAAYESSLAASSDFAGQALAATAEMAPLETAVARDIDDTYEPRFDSIPLVTDARATSASSLMSKQRPRRSTNKLVFGAALLAAAVIGGGVGYVVSHRGTAVPPGDGTIADHIADPNKKDNGAKSDVQEAADDTPMDKQLLWESPTHGEPVPWRYLPLRSEAVLSFRPAQLLAHPEGEKLRSAMGPSAAQAWNATEEVIRAPLSEIEQLTIGWARRGNGWTVTYVLQLADQATSDRLQNHWRQLAGAATDSKSPLITAGRAFYVPDGESSPLLVVADPVEVQELASASTDRVPLLREMFKLERTSDRERLLTLLFSRRALDSAFDHELAAHEFAPLADALNWLLTDHCRAAALSVHLDEHAYVELRLITNPQTATADELAEKVSGRLARLATRVEEYVSQIGLDPYAGRLLIRLGAMARFVERELRVAAEENQVVINAYLPAIAAHNLALAGEWAIARPLQGANPPTDPSPPKPPQDESVAQRLTRPITLVQTGDTLEKALQAISAEIGVPIEILGADLVSEGITRNNRFDVNAKGIPASQTLQSVLRKASPEGKLVYVVKPKLPAGVETILITTRAAAQKRGDALPPEFRTTADRNDS